MDFLTKNYWSTFTPLLLLVQKKQGIENLVLGRGRNLPVDSQKTEEFGDLWFRRFCWMPHAVKANKKTVFSNNMLFQHY